MEATGTVEMFRRSEQEQNIGDGDSAVETALKTEVWYGGLIVKINCINH